MQKIIPHLWFDKEALEAADFYTTVFPDSKITHTSVLKGTPSLDCDVVSFNIMGYSFMAISAGPIFKVNPSVSFMVNFDPSKDAEARTKINEVWGKLVSGGTVFMPLGVYPFSDCYGWIQDKYGVSWQLIYTKSDGEDRPPIIPSMMFAGEVCGKAEEATDYYISVFKESKRGLIARYPSGLETDKEGNVMFTDFKLENQWFAAMDSGRNHEFVFSEGISFIIYCDNQEEVDYYFNKLSAVPEFEQCGWLKDKYGFSWQVDPKRLGEMLEGGTEEQIKNVTEAFLKMKKFDIAELERAYLKDDA